MTNSFKEYRTPLMACIIEIKILFSKETIEIFYAEVFNLLKEQHLK